MKKSLVVRLALALFLTVTAGLFAAAVPAPKPPICEIGCVNEEYCRRDSDCQTRPGGRCNLICPNNGCCVYP